MSGIIGWRGRWSHALTVDSSDVAVVIKEGAGVRAAVAREHNLPDDWMSEAAKGFADILPRDFAKRLVPLDLPLRHLHLYVLGVPEQAAMKIVALRERDLEDLEVLLPSMSQADKETLVAIMQHVGTFRPDWAQRMRYFLLEQGWEIE